MAQKTLKGFIVWEMWDGETEGKFAFQRYQPITQGSGYIQREICPYDLTFDVPDDFDPTGVMVAALVAQKKKAQADFTAMVTKIDRRINSLLAIENTAAA